MFLTFKYNLISLVSSNSGGQVIPDEVTVFFPENRPYQVVENMTANNEKPENSDLLSEKNSRAKNEKLLDDRRSQPFSQGNTPLANLAQPRSLAQSGRVNESSKGPTLKFNRGALLAGNDGYSANQQHPGENSEGNNITMSENNGTDNVFDQTDYSADMLGDMTLSTYAWDWAYYLNMFKTKLYEVWRTPPAYYVLGMIYGNTLMEITIDREGNLTHSLVLEHNGHESLRQSSINAIENSFPLAPLPVDFPDDSLVIRLNLIYPKLTERSK